MNIIILAGGFGKRLRSVVSDVPKPMADIDGVPFLELLIREWLFIDPEKIVLCVSYLKDKIKNHFGKEYLGVPIAYSEEENALDTGGAIKQAFEKFNLDEAIVLNGDTYVKFDFERFANSNAGAPLTVVLKRVEDASRYGRVVVKDNRIISLKEKIKKFEPGFINAGIYKINKSLLNCDLPKKFSFEKDFLEKRVANISPQFIIADDYFIDIGLPESYKKACKELKKIVFGTPKRKVLFLNRDGVINFDTGYVHEIAKCKFIPEIFVICRKYISQGYDIVIVTNQGGIGKGLYSENEYRELMNFISLEFKNNGCSILKEYHCSYHPNGVGKFRRNSFFRKPNPGMLLKAAKEYNIDLNKSIMIGDSDTDILAAKIAGVGKGILMKNGKIIKCTLLNKEE